MKFSRVVISTKNENEITIWNVSDTTIHLEKEKKAKKKPKNF